MNVLVATVDASRYAPIKSAVSPVPVILASSSILTDVLVLVGTLYVKHVCVHRSCMFNAVKNITIVCI